jgi:hypothetical protein
VYQTRKGVEHTRHVDCRGPRERGVPEASRAPAWLVFSGAYNCITYSNCVDYLWMGTDGMKMNGTNGSQLWDTAFMARREA